MLAVVAAVLLKTAQVVFLHHQLQVAVALVAVAQVLKQRLVRGVMVQMAAQTLVVAVVDRHQVQL
jgi:hypothetical protein